MKIMSPWALLRSIKDIDTDRKKFPDFKQQSDEAIAASALLLGISVFVGHGAGLAMWIQRGLGGDPAVLTMNAAVLVGAITLAIVSLSDRWQPYMSFLVALEHLVLDVASCITFQLYLVSDNANHRCMQLESELVLAELCIKFAWFSFIASLAGYTRLGVLAILWKPVALAVLLLLPPASTAGWRFFVLAGWRFVAISLFISIAAIVCSVHLTLRQRQAFHAQAHRVQQQQQEYSGAINHVVKNSMANAKAELVLLFDAQPDLQSVAGLHNVVAILTKGIRWCKSHVVCARLAAGQPLPVTPQPLSLREFGADVVADRRVLAAVADATIRTDPALLDVMLETALDNAARHGDPRDPDVRLTVTAADADTSSAASGADPCRVATFTVSNCADPARPPLPDDIVAQVLSPDAPPSAWARGLGLRHCFRAAELLGAQFGLRQKGARVTFWAKMRVAVVPPTGGPPGATAPATAPALVADLKIYVIDDSSSMRKWMSHALAGLGTVKCFGAEAEDVSAFVAATLRDGDVAVCDQNLEFATGTAYGTDLVKQLREGGFQGLLCIHSANDAPEDVAKYSAAGAHLSLGKGMRRGDLVTALRQAYAECVAARCPEDHPGACTPPGSDTPDTGPPTMPSLPGAAPDLPSPVCLSLEHQDSMEWQIPRPSQQRLLGLSSSDTTSTVDAVMRIP